MSERQLPIRIQTLLRSVSCSCAVPSYVHHGQDTLREWVGDVANAHEDGWGLLREGAVAQLADADAEMVVRALTVLFVVGIVTNAPAVEPLLSHHDTRVQKAARTCLFEIRRRAD